MPDKNINEIFCENLKEQLTKNNLTYSHLAKALGISKSTVSMWITGKNLPRMDLLDKIADYLGITVSELTTESTENEGQGYYLNDDARAAAQFLYENPEYKVLFDATRKVKKEDILFVKEMLDRMRKED